MSPLDQLLRALRERKADALILVAGEAAQLKTGTEMKALTRQHLSATAIRSLLATVCGEDDIARLDEGQALTFQARLHEDETAVFSGIASHSGGILTVAITPERKGHSTQSARVKPVAESQPETLRLHVDDSRDGSLPVDGLLRAMSQRGASDLHLAIGQAPMMRLDGILMRLEGTPILTKERMDELVIPVMPERQSKQFQSSSDADFAYELAGVARYRVNVYRDRHGMSAAFRLIPTRVQSARELGLPQAVQDLCHLTKGLVLVTGPTGSGKSTTLAALVDLINRERRDHIITIEDPIEFVHESKGCLLSQREVGVHTQSFKTALRAALREDPDVVLVGEMRDLETIAIAIETAVTGHLVFGTLHTSTAIQTVDRVIDQFPGERQTQIRVMLADCLKAVVAQTLLRKKGGGRIAALEVLLGTAGVANLIREAKTFQIPSFMQTGKGIGMTCLNDVLLDYVKHGIVDPKEAYMKAVDKEAFAKELARAGIALSLKHEAPKTLALAV